MATHCCTVSPAQGHARRAAPTFPPGGLPPTHFSITHCGRRKRFPALPLRVTLSRGEAVAVAAARHSDPGNTSASLRLHALRVTEVRRRGVARGRPNAPRYNKGVQVARTLSRLSGADSSGPRSTPHSASRLTHHASAPPLPLLSPVSLHACARRRHGASHPRPFAARPAQRCAQLTSSERRRARGLAARDPLLRRAALAASMTRQAW